MAATIAPGDFISFILVLSRMPACVLDNKLEFYFLKVIYIKQKLKKDTKTGSHSEGSHSQTQEN